MCSRTLERQLILRERLASAGCIHHQHLFFTATGEPIHHLRYPYGAGAPRCAGSQFGIASPTPLTFVSELGLDDRSQSPVRGQTAWSHSIATMLWVGLCRLGRGHHRGRCRVDSSGDGDDRTSKRRDGSSPFDRPVPVLSSRREPAPY